MNQLSVFNHQRPAARQPAFIDWPIAPDVRRDLAGRIHKCARATCDELVLDGEYCNVCAEQMLSLRICRTVNCDNHAAQDSAFCMRCREEIEALNRDAIERNQRREQRRERRQARMLNLLLAWQEFSYWAHKSKALDWVLAAFVVAGIMYWSLTWGAAVAAWLNGLAGVR